MSTTTKTDAGAIFLAALAQHGRVAWAAEAAAMSPQAFYQRAARDRTFKHAWEDAIREAREWATITLRKINGSPAQIRRHLEQVAAQLYDADLTRAEVELIQHKMAQLQERLKELA